MFGNNLSWKKRLEEVAQICREAESATSSAELHELIQELEAIRRQSKTEHLLLRSLTWNALDSLVRYFQQQQKGMAKNIGELRQGIAEMQDQFRDLTVKLKQARERIAALQRPPHQFVVFERLEERKLGTEVEYWIRFRRGQAHSSATVDIGSPSLVEAFKKAKVGQWVRLNGNGVAVELLDEFDQEGAVVEVREVLGQDRLRVSADSGNEIVIVIGETLKGSEVAVGDKVLLSVNQLAVAKIASAALAKDSLLQKVPNIRWSDIGGLDKEIGLFRKELETHLLFPDSAKRFDLPEPKGILLVGPPGNGKTLIAKAAVNEIARFISEKTGKNVEGYYILAKGPAEVYEKWVGSSPRNLKSFFTAARRKAAEGHLVFILFDEFEQIVPLRRSESYDSGVGGQVVTQFSSEMDGIDELHGVVVIAITNRADLIDPAVIRPGRFDLKIHISLQGRPAATAIFQKHLRPHTPLHQQYFDPANYDEEGFYYPRDRQQQKRQEKRGETIKYPLQQDPQKIVDYLVEQAVARCYDSRRSVNRLRRIVYADGTEQVFTFSDFMSGARIAGIAALARKKAHSRWVEATAEDKKGEGLKLVDLHEAIDELFRSDVEIPSTPETFRQWLLVQGKETPAIRSVISLLKESDAEQELADKNNQPTMA